MPRGVYPRKTEHIELLRRIARERNNIAWNKGKTMSDETREKMSISHRGSQGYWTGKKRSPETIAKVSAARKGKPPWNKGKTYPQIANERHFKWKGENVGYVGLHIWVRKNLPKPELCPECNEVRRLEVSNVSPRYNSETYNRDLNNWRWLCHKCHMSMDGISVRLMKAGIDTRIKQGQVLRK